MTSVVTRALLSSSRTYLTIFRKTKLLCISVARIHMENRDATKSSMELINVPPLVSTYRQALRTFDVKLNNEFDANLSKLKLLMDKLRSEDFGFDNRLKDPVIWYSPKKPPCTYIEVFQNKRVHMSIFVLKPGFKMPLHDHPHMHGLLKVISGAVRIRSFTEYPLKEVVNMLDFKTRAKHEAARLAKGFHQKRKLFAQISNDRYCSDNAETCVLTPTISNYHEIEALELPAAFFDILSPPYDTFIKEIGPRRCRYYQVVQEISTNVVELHETEVPSCFYCDTSPYLGPILG